MDMDHINGFQLNNKKLKKNMNFYYFVFIIIKMNFNTILTKDKEFVRVNILKSIDIQISDLVFNQFINLLVHLKDEQGTIFKSEIIRIQNDEYNSWGLDDDYIMNLVLQKIGAEKLDI